MNEKLTLQEIALWQLSPNSEVRLPIIQRGFVWKPKQIEDLWDSILRGFPIGSFLMQEIGDNYDLLDGQQRATAIALGFINPFSPKKVELWDSRTRKLSPVLWIDLDSRLGSKPEANKFLIRVTTNAHPWGYKSKTNNEILSLADRRKALELYKIDSENKTKGYTEFSNTTVFPYDATFPIPLSFFIESRDVDEVIKNVSNLPEYIKTKSGSFNNRQEFIKLLESDLKSSLDELFTEIKERISESRVNFDLMSNKIINQEETQESSTLFVRINSSGTALGGDDLIYSIYKSHFPESKETVERAGLDFAPAKLVVSFVSRLAWSMLDNGEYPKKFLIKQFQERIRKVEYRDKLQELVGTEEKNSEISKLIKKAIEILRSEDVFDERIPDFLVKQFVLKAPDLFLFLIAWLKNYETIELSKEIRKKIVAKLYTLQWLGFSGDENYRKFWNENIKNENFWNDKLTPFMEASLKKGVKVLLPPELLWDYFTSDNNVNSLVSKNNHDAWGYLPTPEQKVFDYYDKIKNDLSVEQKIDLFKSFIFFIRDTRNKSLLAFAQRSYLNDEFKDYNSMDNLEDSNVPWDWDHIYPASWIDKKRYKDFVGGFSIKVWTWSIGNFRALSLEQNRTESNKLSPKDRLEDLETRKNSFICDSDWQYWEMISGERNEDAAKNHLRAITTRMLNIYENLWNEMNLKDLVEGVI